MCIALLLLIRTLVGYGTEGDNHPSVTCDMNFDGLFSDQVYVGVSDPMNDADLAYDQAVKRALAFYVIGTDMNISSVYEYYYLDANLNRYDLDNQKSHWIAEITAEGKDISYKVKKQYRTKYNETIVVLNITDDAEDKVDVNVSGTFMYHYDFDNNEVVYGEKQFLTIQIDDSSSVLEWISTIDNRNHSKISVFDGKQNILRYSKNYYEDHSSINDDMFFCENKFGLWNSFIDTFFQSLSVFESQQLVIKNTSRQILQETNGTYEDKNQNIARLVMRTNISCSLTKLSLKNNTMYANWEIKEK